MATRWQPQESTEVDESIPIPYEDDDERPAFTTVRMIEGQVSHGSEDPAWHPELAAGQPCPVCQRYRLRAFRHTVYCHFCRKRWWCQSPYAARKEGQR